jgi:hypothetical protein
MKPRLLQRLTIFSMRVTEAWVDIMSVWEIWKWKGAWESVQRSADLFKVVNDCFLAAGFEDLFDKLNVEWVNLVGFLSVLARENKVKGDLVALVDHAAFTWGHFAHVKAQDTLDGAQIAFGPGNELLGGVGDFRAGPENNDM